MRPKQTRAPRGIPAGGQFASSPHTESTWAQMFPDPKFPPGTRLATQDGQYGDVFGDTTRDVLTVAMDGGGVVYASHAKLSSIEDYLNATMPQVEGENLPPLPEESPASAVHAFLLEHRPAADLAANPATRGRERVALQLRSALASTESDPARITAGTLPESPAAQPLTGKRSRQLALHFMEQARGFGDVLRRHQLDTTPAFHRPGAYRPVHAIELELTAARDSAAEAAVRFTAGIDSLSQDQRDVYTERAVVLLGDFIVKTPELANVAWNDAEWVPPAATS